MRGVGWHTWACVSFPGSPWTNPQDRVIWWMNIAAWDAGLVRVERKHGRGARVTGAEYAGTPRRAAPRQNGRAKPLLLADGRLYRFFLTFSSRPYSGAELSAPRFMLRRTHFLANYYARVLTEGEWKYSAHRPQERLIFLTQVGTQPSSPFAYPPDVEEKRNCHAIYVMRISAMR